MRIKTRKYSIKPIAWTRSKNREFFTSPHSLIEIIPSNNIKKSEYNVNKGDCTSTKSHKFINRF